MMDLPACALKYEASLRRVVLVFLVLSFLPLLLLIDLPVKEIKAYHIHTPPRLDVVPAVFMYTEDCFFMFPCRTFTK